MEKQELWTKDFLNISLSSFFLFTSFYCLLVTLPIHALREFNSKEYEAGLIVTVFIFAAILIRPFAGSLIVRFGKQATLVGSLLFFTTMASLYFIPETLLSLLALRFLQGLGFGMATTVAGTMVADIIPEKRRGEGMGYYTMSMNLAMVIGPFVGLTAFGKWGITADFVIGIFCGLAGIASAASVALPQEVRRREVVTAPVIRLDSLVEGASVKISMVGAFFALIYSGVLSFVSVYAKEIGLESVSSFFFVVYAAAILLSRPFTGKWFDRYGANFIVYPAIALFAGGMFVLSITHSPIWFLAAAALIGLGWGTLFPLLQTIAIQLAPPGKRALATATFLSIFDLGIGVGSAVVGLIGAQIGFSSLYMISALLVLTGFLLYHLLHGKDTRKKQEVSPISEAM